MNSEINEITFSLKDLLSSRAQGEPGGFVIFEGASELEYVQFSLGKSGLSLYWPVGGKKTLVEMERCKQTLDELGLVEIVLNGNDARLTIESMKVNAYVVLDDGLYSNLGRDEVFASTLTAKLFADVYNFFDLKKLNISLNIDG